MNTGLRTCPIFKSFRKSSRQGITDDKRQPLPTLSYGSDSSCFGSSDRDMSRALRLPNLFVFPGWGHSLSFKHSQYMQCDIVVDPNSQKHIVRTLLFFTFHFCEEDPMAEIQSAVRAFQWAHTKLERPLFEELVNIWNILEFWSRTEYRLRSVELSLRAC